MILKEIIKYIELIYKCHYNLKENKQERMMKNEDIKGTKQKNLLEAFAGESQARNKYTYYASKLKEGYEQIAAIFQKQRQ